MPYKGSAPALTDVIGGHIALLFADPAPTLPLIKAGKVRALGVHCRVCSQSPRAYVLARPPFPNPPHRNQARRVAIP